MKRMRVINNDQAISLHGIIATTVQIERMRRKASAGLSSSPSAPGAGFLVAGAVICSLSIIFSIEAGPHGLVAHFGAFAQLFLVALAGWRFAT